MKYLLLDTNIYLNMIVNRRRDSNDHLLSTFTKLLEYEEIKIILPEIVKHEVFKHLENEVSKIGNNLEDTKAKIESIYWINGIEENSFDINNYKENASKYIQEVQDYFKNNEEYYVAKLETRINSIFESQYSVFIEDNEKIINKALKRKVYKKAPCHIKDSYADAIIVETLINLKDYIDIQEDDIIYFISDNPEDFSKNKGKDREVLHPDIIKDLEESQLLKRIEYGTNFSKLIMNSLAAEIENANLKEEFEREFENEQFMEDYEYHRHVEDINRESANLSSLSSFDELVTDKIYESKEAKEILSLFEMINEIYIDLEKIHGFYSDELAEILNFYINEDNIKYGNFIINFNKFITKNKLNYYSYSIEDILNWVMEQESQVNFEYNLRLSDCIDIEENVVLYDANKNRVSLYWESTQLSPESGGMDTIHWNVIKDYSDIKIAEGRIEIIYGFIEVLDSGNIGDGCQDDIEVYLEPVVYAIQNIYEGLDELRIKHENYVDYIRNNVIEQSSDGL